MIARWLPLLCAESHGMSVCTKVRTLCGLVIVTLTPSLGAGPSTHVAVPALLVTYGDGDLFHFWKRFASAGLLRTEALEHNSTLVENPEYGQSSGEVTTMLSAKTSSLISSTRPWYQG